MPERIEDVDWKAIADARAKRHAELDDAARGDLYPGDFPQVVPGDGRPRGSDEPDRYTPTELWLGRGDYDWRAEEEGVALRRALELRGFDLLAVSDWIDGEFPFALALISAIPWDNSTTWRETWVQGEVLSCLAVAYKLGESDLTFEETCDALGFDRTPRPRRARV